jgi:hypothetical protein
METKKIKIINIIYSMLFILFFVALLSLKIVENLKLIPYHSIEVRILVPLFAGITCLYSLLIKGYEKTMLIAIALLFAMIAEIINAANLDFGLLFFAITHTCLTIFHWKKTSKLEHELIVQNNLGRMKKMKILEYVSLAVFAVLFVLITVLIEINIHPENLEYQLVVPLYLLVLSLMAWRSICTYGERGSLKIILGSVLFYLCDVFILAELATPNFDFPPLYLIILSWITYVPALFLLSTIGKNIFEKDN